VQSPVFQAREGGGGVRLSLPSRKNLEVRSHAEVPEKRMLAAPVKKNKIIFFDHIKSMKSIYNRSNFNVDNNLEPN
jgi:hypothetical protein